MSVLVVGVSHKTAPVELRERLAVPSHLHKPTLECLKANGSLQEMVLLATCNRVEIYARPASDHFKAAEELKNFFMGFYQHPQLSLSIYQHEGVNAVRHLFRVASGLDSLVVGETEVLGQVKNSYLFAYNCGVTGKVTNVLFQRALFVGKSVRNKTAVSEGASSVGSIAVQLAERIFNGLERHRVLLLGAGKMAEITARHLLSQKACQLTILNRTKSKADELANLLNGKSGSMDDLDSELLQADIVICSTSAQKPIITKDMIQDLMKRRRMRSLYFIDIAVPRNVEPEVHKLDNVYVYNIDDLESLVRENLAGRQKEVAAAEDLVSHLSDEFFLWLEAALKGQNRPLRHTV